MAFSLIFLPRARQEISDALNWYEKRQKGLGNSFLSELESEFERIIENPFIFPRSNGSDTEFRKAVLKRFPFLILFTLSVDQIIVHSVFHTSLNPSKKP